MKHRSKIKKVFCCITVLALSLVLFACGGSEDETRDVGAITMDEIQENPEDFLGEVSLTGRVGNIGSLGFTLVNEAENVHIIVEYRGSEALPDVGEMVTVDGTLLMARSCCDEAFMLSSTHFERHGE